MRTWCPLDVTSQCDLAFISCLMSIMVTFIWTFSADSTPYHWRIASFGGIASSSSVGCCVLDEWLIQCVFLYRQYQVWKHYTKSLCMCMQWSSTSFRRASSSLLMQLHQVVHPWLPPAPVHSSISMLLQSTILIVNGMYHNREWSWDHSAPVVAEVSSPSSSWVSKTLECWEARMICKKCFDQSSECVCIHRWWCKEYVCISVYKFVLRKLSI
jgi:hypothetical protein